MLVESTNECVDGYLKQKSRSINCGFLEFGAENEIRTRDPDLGKVVLYQLSYSRKEDVHYRPIFNPVNP